MSVRKKTISIIVATVIFLIGSLSFIARFVLLRSYTQLETREISRNVARVEDALFTEIGNLNRTAGDWANWDDTYAFAQGNYPEYPADNLMDAAFDTLRLNLMLFLDCSGTPTFGKAYDLTAYQEIPVPGEFLPRLSSQPLFTCQTGTEEALTGIILLDQHPLLLAARPILTSDQSGPPMGTLVVGRFLDAEEVARLSQVTHLAVDVTPLNSPTLAPELQEVLASFSQEQPVSVQPLDEQTVLGYGLVRDISGEPALMIKVEMARDTYRQGQTSLSYFTTALLVACLIFGGVILFQLEKVVITRLARLNHKVQEIGASKDHSYRLPLEGKDELTNLSTEINRMLASLEQSEQAQRQLERRNILRAVPDLMFVLTQDGELIEVKADLANRLNLDPQDLIGKNLNLLGFSDEALGQITRAIYQALQTGEEQAFEITYSTNDSELFFDVRMVALNDSEVLAVARDITGRKQAEEALRESEERYTLAVAGARDGIWDWDLRTDKIYFSPRWQAMLGYSEGEISDDAEDWFRLIHPEDQESFHKQIAAHLEGSTNHLESELRVLHKDGAYRWMLYRGLAVHRNGSKPARLAGSQTDTTERKYFEQQLQHKALHDELTNLPNRTLFMDRLSHALDRAKRHPDFRAAVLFFDLDRFKLINDSLGHAMGDLLLVAIARRLTVTLRPGDTISRFGGDEFAILVEDVQNVGDAIRVAERVQRELAKPHDLKGNRVYINASIGIAFTSPDYKRSDDLLRDADTAMYRAKSKGQARIEIFDAPMHTQTLRMLQMEAGLRQALKKNQLRLHYQPILSLKSGKITGVEALLRWQHPKRGLLLPGEFLSLAEETELILPIGEWVLRTACTQARAWHESGYSGLPVAVNISARQFLDKNLPKIIQTILAETGLPPGYLEIEITEQTAMQDIDLTINTLVELRDVSVQISIDDFGNGYSALGYLKLFPVNTLKIDRSFIIDVSRREDDAAITSAIIAMAHVLNLNVIAEGVETEEQMNFLLAQQCDNIQGFLISRALPPEELVHLLAERGIEPRQPHSLHRSTQADPERILAG